MSINKVECSYCIIGIGYTSFIAAYLLAQKGINSLILGNIFEKSTFQIQVATKSISPIPIFPVKNSGLYDLLSLNSYSPDTIIKVGFSEIKNFDVSDFKFTENSFADFVLHNNKTDRELCLSLKQWGMGILTQEYSEVKNKIKRHYLSKNGNSRVGFCNGHSVYYKFVNEHPGSVLHYNNIKEIDYKAKIILTDNMKIHYEKIISTIPLNRLLVKCGFHDRLALKYEGSYFYYFSHLSRVQENQILYDCDYKSIILRVFCVTDNIIMVQLPYYRKDSIAKELVIQRLKELIPGLENLVFEKDLSFPMSYPLETITNSNAINWLKKLQENEIFPFGRFGSWEYADLHELNWDSII